MVKTSCNEKKKVIIVGAGISGMAAGIYLLDNGYDVEIYEKHEIPGGACCGWVREGQYIDGCAHWIIGSNPNSSLRPLWDHIGAYGDEIRVIPVEELTTFYFDGKPFSFTNDLDKLEKDLIELSPIDKKAIKGFIRTIRAYSHIRIPVKKPLDGMNLFEFMGFGMSMLKAAIPYAIYRKMSIVEYAKRFKDERIGQMLIRFMGEEYNMHSLFYVLQAFTTNDAGIPEGGSMKMSLRVAKRFQEKGGKLFLSSPIKKIRFNGKVAEGVELENGTFIAGDYVVAASDVHHTFEKLCPDIEMPRFFKERFLENATYPLRSAFQLSFQTTADLSNRPRMMDFEMDPVTVGNERWTSFPLRNFSFDSTLSRGKKTLLTVLMPTGEKTYDYLASLSEEEYAKEKERIGKIFFDAIVKNLGIQESELKLLDVATPLTYTRYTNAYKGAYMSFVTTKRSKGLITTTKVKGYSNFLVAGQWLMPPGGLPIAIIVGKHAAYTICSLDHVRFKNLETRKVKGLLRTKTA